MTEAEYQRLLEVFIRNTIDLEHLAAWTIEAKIDIVPKQCDCGAQKVKTTHADWCSVKEKMK